MKILLGFICAAALFIAVAQAQTSSTSSTTTTGAGTSETTTTTTETTGTGEPVRYKFSKSVTYVTPDGKVVEASKVRKNSKVRVHYIKEGSDMLVDKVIVTDND